MEEPSGRAVYVLMLGLLGLVIGLGLGQAFGRHVARQEAVRAGVARWEADPETGRSEFVYGKVEGKTEGGCRCKTGACGR